MVKKNRISHIITTIIGSSDTFSMENRIYNLNVFIVIAGFFIIIIVNILLNLGIFIILSCIVTMAIFSFFYYLSRIKQWYKPLIVPGVVLGFISLSILWGHNAGSRGTIFYAYFVGVCIIIVFFKSKGRIIGILVLYSNVIILFCIEYFYPTILSPYENDTIRLVDIATTLIITLSCTAVIISVVVNGYQFEKQRADALLLNILPQTIAARLKKENTIIAEDYHDVSILFLDIVDFTRFATTVRPKEVVNVLNTIFSFLDTLVERYGLEKIKTIGDAYMVAGGIPLPDEGHGENILNMALDIMAHKDTLDIAPMPCLNIRIGIHRGPVVAGVIGKKKFAYDLWGDAVNTASRLEHHCEPNKIHVSEEIARRMQDGFAFEKRGTIAVKGKGDLTTYYLMDKKGI